MGAGEADAAHPHYYTLCQCGACSMYIHIYSPSLLLHSYFQKGFDPAVAAAAT